MEFFNKMKELIEKVYLELTKDLNGDYMGGKSFLYLENKQEPFNGGVIYNPTPPNKRFTYDTE